MLDLNVGEGIWEEVKVGGRRSEACFKTLLDKPTGMWQHEVGIGPESPNFGGLRVSENRTTFTMILCRK